MGWRKDEPVSAGAAARIRSLSPRIGLLPTGHRSWLPRPRGRFPVPSPAQGPRLPPRPGRRITPRTSSLNRPYLARSRPWHICGTPNVPILLDRHGLDRPANPVSATKGAGHEDAHAVVVGAGGRTSSHVGIRGVHDAPLRLLPGTGRMIASARDGGPQETAHPACRSGGGVRGPAGHDPRGRVIRSYFFWSLVLGVSRVGMSSPSSFTFIIRTSSG